MSHCTYKSSVKARMGAKTLRLAVQKLDSCLELVEDALERGEDTVSPQLAASVEAQWPSTGIKPGIALNRALERVFEEQSQYMADPHGGQNQARSAFGLSRRTPMSEHEARDLTMRIKSEMRQTCLLLLQAHDGCAWKALGYSSWERYVHHEFGYSRSRSYELLDQGRVVHAVQEAFGPVPIPFISAYAAGEIKPHIDQVVGEIRRKVSMVGQEHWPEIARNIIQGKRAEARNHASSSKSSSVSEEEGGKEADPRGRSTRLPMRVGASISRSELLALNDYLAELPSANEAAIALTGADASKIELISKVIDWLTDLRSSLQRHESCQEANRPLARIAI